MNPKLMQGITVMVCLVIAAVSFFGGVGRHGWMVGIVGLVLAAIALTALIRGWSIFDRPGPF